MLKCYKKDHTILYYENTDHKIHFTTDKHFEDYIRLRKSVPKGCVLFTLQREMNKAIDDGALETALAIAHTIEMQRSEQCRAIPSTMKHYVNR